MNRYAAGICLTAALITAAAIQAEEASPPDFSGLWMPSRDFTRVKGFPRQNPPYTPWARQLVDDFRAVYDPNKDEPAFFCIPPGMPGTMAFGAPFPLEIIQRPQDITMFFEGYFQYRKIYLEGHARPDPVLPTRMGYAVGRWEGDTLVVTTTNLAEQTTGSTISTEDARIEERMSLEVDADGHKRLVDHITYRDPKALTEEIHMTGIWEWSPDTPILEYVCTEEIYQQHLQRVRELRLRDRQ